MILWFACYVSLLDNNLVIVAMLSSIPQFYTNIIVFSARIPNLNLRAERRNVRRQTVRNQQLPVMWWDRLAVYKPRHDLIEWSHNCTKCGSILLRTEDDGWCCTKGKLIRPPLPEYPQPLLDEFAAHSLDYSTKSRALNNLFAFTAIGVAEGSFINFDFGGPANVALSGRIYHRILHLDQGEHSLKWFLYDEDGRQQAAHRHEVPEYMVDSFRNLLEDVNPFLRSIRTAISQAPEGQLALAIQLD